MIDTLTVAMVIATFFIGGFVKGTIGLGLPVVVLVIMSQVIPVADAIAIFVIPGVVSNIWQATNGPWLRPLVRRLWPFLVAAVVGIVAGVSILAGATSESTAALLGALLIAYSLYSLLAPRLPEPGRHEIWMGPAASSSAGVLFGMTGIFIVPGILYLEALRLPRDQFVQALGITFITLTGTMTLTLAGYDLLTLDHVILSLIALGPVFAGLWTGQKMRHRISETGFRKVFFVALIFVGLHMIYRSGVLI